MVYCANCREVFREQGKPCSHLLELLFGPAGEVPYLSQKRQNTLRVKGELMRTMQNTSFDPPVHPWDGIVLHIPDSVRREMEEHLICDDDVKECIFAAGRRHPAVRFGAAGHHLLGGVPPCCIRRF